MNYKKHAIYLLLYLISLIPNIHIAFIFKLNICILNFKTNYVE